MYVQNSFISYRQELGFTTNVIFIIKNPNLKKMKNLKKNIIITSAAQASQVIVSGNNPVLEKNYGI